MDPSRVLKFSCASWSIDSDTHALCSKSRELIFAAGIFCQFYSKKLMYILIIPVNKSIPIILQCFQCWECGNMPVVISVTLISIKSRR